MRHLWVTKRDSGYSMTTRTGQAATESLLKRFGQKIFDAGSDRGTGSGRGEKGSKRKGR
jgi:hypothetical protein